MKPFHKLRHSVSRYIMGLKRPSKVVNTRRLIDHGESLASFIIREVKESEIPKLAALHVKTWNETYWTVIRKPTYEIRKWQWDAQFKIKGGWFCFVVENCRGELVGFAMSKHYSHSDLPEFSGELNKIYLLRRYQRLGLGIKLLGHVARKFLGEGISNMVLFGIPENPTGKFHETMGGERLFAKNGEFHGGYCWKDLRKLAENCPVD